MPAKRKPRKRNKKNQTKAGAPMSRSKGGSSQSSNQLSKAGVQIVNQLGREAAIYQRSLVHPYDGPLPTIPSLPACLTRRERLYARGTVSTQITGFAGAGIATIAMSPSLGLARDQPFVVTNAPNFAQTTMPNAVAAGNGAAVFSNSEFLTAQFGNTLVRGRVVSAGLRLRYIGTELNMGGQMVCLNEPNHDSLGTQTFAFLESYQESRNFLNSRKWVNIPYKPVLDTEDDFTSTFPVFNSVGTNYMCVMINDATAGATPLTFEYQAYINCEFIGPSIRDKIPSIVDLNGYGAVHTAMVSNPLTNSPHDKDSTALGNQMVVMANQIHNGSTGAKMFDNATKTVQNLHSGFKGAVDFGKAISSFAADLIPAFL